MRVSEKGSNVTYRWMILLLTITVVVSGCGTISSANGTASPAYSGQLRGAVFDPPRTLTDFSLPSTTGSPFTLSAHKGQIVLIYFGYLTCPDICPTTLAELQNIYLHLNQPVNQVKVLFVTVDPDRDSLANLTSYTHAFSADFIGARAEGDPLKAVMGQFGVTAERRPVADSPLSYLIDHTASIFLVGPDQRLLAQYLYGTDYRDIVHDVQAILQSA